MKKIMSIYIDDKIIQQIKEIAENKKRSMNFIITELIKNYLKDDENE